MDRAIKLERSGDFDNSQLVVSFGGRNILGTEVGDLVIITRDVVNRKVSTATLRASVQPAAFDVASSFGILVIGVDSNSGSAIDEHGDSV
jgi:hypothetical protein